IGVATLKEYIAWLKNNPTRASFGTTAMGSFTHFYGVMTGQAIGVPLEPVPYRRSEEHTSELQSLTNLVCRLLLEKKKNNLAIRSRRNGEDRSAEPRVSGSATCASVARAAAVQGGIGELWHAQSVGATRSRRAPGS